MAGVILKVVPNRTGFRFMGNFPEFTKYESWTRITRQLAQGTRFPVRCIGVFDQHALVGLFAFNIGKQIRAHVCFKEGYRGAFALRAGRAVIQWVFEKTPFQEIHAQADLPHVRVFAAKCGMERSANGFVVKNVQRN